MCDPVTLGLILTAGGTGAQAINNMTALRRQDNEAARGIRRQGEIQRESNQRVGENIENLAASTGMEERAQSLAGFQDALRAADTQSTGAVQPVVGANPRFAEAVSQSQAKIRGGANDRAGRLSVIDGAILQRLNEGNDQMRTVTDLNENAARSRAQDFITQLRIAERRPNEFVDALGSLMQGAGSAITLGGGSGLPSFLKGGPNLGKLAKAGTIIDAPLGTPGFNPFANAVRTV